ncbi:TIGR02391 family protein [Gordonia paraffinivorans]|uniref:TIGR02391 family protein n=1 Tax=Gordonia paraffinivorans TaxID=175628 RepID=UPI001E484A5A|nr:TIGR02391 family protein [Gordonia paraffinivorans]MCD2143964.1 TIGR02391 family protein [Gordonia paraffinivorans]
MTEYGVDYLKRLLDATQEFETAFEKWMETQSESTHMESRGLFPTVRTLETADPDDVARLELEVARRAGAASSAVSVTGAYIVIAGLGAIDPIANWSIMSAPKAPITPRDVRACAANVRGRLEAMIADAEASAGSDLPAFSPANLHHLIWSAAAVHWTAHQYRVAVREAAEALVVHWKTKLGREDVKSDTSFWQQTLSDGEPKEGVPKLVWPGDPTTTTSSNMRGGLAPLAKALNEFATGLNLTIRNVTTHSRDELSEQEAMERLAAYSYLARLLDVCEIRRFERDNDEPENGEEA